jgi:hypothetical protein
LNTEYSTGWTHRVAHTLQLAWINVGIRKYRMPVALL